MPARDAEGDELDRATRDGLADLKRLHISRWGRIPNLSTDPVSPPDGSIWLRSDLGEARYRTNGTTRFTPGAGAGAPAGTGSNGEEYYDTSNKRNYLSDGVGWVVMSEPAITTFVPAISSTAGTITTVGAVSFSYHRSDGYLDWAADISITTNGTGTGAVHMTFPIANLGGIVGGSFREINVTGSFCSVTMTGGAAGDVLTYNNGYPMGSGQRIIGSGRYPMTTRYS